MVRSSGYAKYPDRDLRQRRSACFFSYNEVAPTQVPQPPPVQHGTPNRLFLKGEPSFRAPSSWGGASSSQLFAADLINRDADTCDSRFAYVTLGPHLSKKLTRGRPKRPLEVSVEGPSLAAFAPYILHGCQERASLLSLS